MEGHACAKMPVGVLVEEGAGLLLRGDDRHLHGRIIGRCPRCAFEACESACPVNFRFLERMSFVMTSSFFCSSPCMLMLPPPPSYPVIPVMHALSTRLRITLHA